MVCIKGIVQKNIDLKKIVSDFMLEIIILWLFRNNNEIYISLLLNIPTA